MICDRDIGLRNEPSEIPEIETSLVGSFARLLQRNNVVVVAEGCGAIKDAQAMLVQPVASSASS